MSWTSFPSYISKSLLHRWKSNSITHGNKNGLDDNNGNDISVIVFRLPSLHKKWSFPLRISSLNVIKSRGTCGFGEVDRQQPMVNNYQNLSEDVAFKLTLNLG